MKEVKVTELRQNLPGYLAKVQRGERIKITSRGKVVAELAPPASPPDMVAAARARLRGSVRRYVRPLASVVDANEWDMNR
jgi:prevent-host-death family protein